MTWEELKEEAKKMGGLPYTYNNGEEVIELDVGEDLEDSLDFHIGGQITFNLTRIAEHRTPDQMLAIMKALQ